MIMLRLESEHRWIGHEEFGDMFMYDTKYDVYLGLKTFDDLKRVLDIIDEHGCHITTFGYLNNMNGFRIEIKKDDSCDENKEKKIVIEDNKESLIAIAILSTAGNVVDMLNIVRGGRNEVIEVIAKYFKDIITQRDKEGIHWETEIPLNAFDDGTCFHDIKPAEKISSDESDYYVKIRKIEEGSFIPFTSSTPEWVTFKWTGEDMAYFHQLIIPKLATFNEK